MKVSAALFVSDVLISRCPATTPQVAPQHESSWRLMASPPSRDFPQGTYGIPLARWTRVREFPTFEACNALEQDARDKVGTVVDCVASDNPLLKEAQD